MRWLKTFGGAVAVYVVVAACGATRSGTTSGSDAAGAIDALTDPVSSADAAPQTVAVEQCSGSFSAGGTTHAYAEHLFPGKSTTDLASVSVVFSLAALGVTSPVPGGYTSATAVGSPIWLHDGAAAVECASASSSVTFVLP